MFPTKFTKPLLGLDWLEWYGDHKVYHPAIDLGLAGQSDCGQEVVAPKSGFIEYIYDAEWGSGGFGKFIIMVHSDGNFTRYAHLQSIAVKQAQEVKAGQVIGYLGRTGTTSCHLHWEVMNPDGAELQRKHWKAWRMYPSNWSKQEVQKYYINPWTWVEDVGIPVWAVEAVKWAQENEIITNVLQESVDDVRLAKILHNFYIKFVKP